MNFWLFQVMYDPFPDLWEKTVCAGVAAEHYPPGWTNEARNIDALRCLKKGDKIIAAFKNHRVAGIGTLTSGFYRGGKPFRIGPNRLEFQERFNCAWETIPLKAKPPYMDIHDLKKQGFNIDLTRGLCVKHIKRETFQEIQKRLMKAGVTVYKSSRASVPFIANDKTSPPPRAKVMTIRVIRDTSVTKRLKTLYNYRCQICNRRIDRGDSCFYAEAHHIKPLGKNHRGIDAECNLIVLCPNHHAFFDFGIPKFIANDKIKIGNKAIRLKLKHQIDSEVIDYYNTSICISS